MVFQRIYGRLKISEMIGSAWKQSKKPINDYFSSPRLIYRKVILIAVTLQKTGMCPEAYNADIS